MNSCLSSRAIRRAPAPWLPAALHEPADTSSRREGCTSSGNISSRAPCSSPRLARSIRARRRAVASTVSGWAWVLISASFKTGSGAWRMDLERDVAAHGMAGERETRRGLAQHTGSDRRHAVVPDWLATITGPNRHSAGMTGRRFGPRRTAPEPAQMGVVWSIIASKAPRISGNYAAELKCPGWAVKYAKTHVNLPSGALTRARGRLMKRAHDTT